MFIANNLMLLEGKNLDTIAEAQSLNTFSKIRYDLDKLSYSMYIAEIVNNICSKQFNKDENYEEIYELIFSVYEKIANSNSKKDVLFNALKFQIKIMSILGWGLDFNYCSICQKKIDDDSYFSFSEGDFLCRECIKNSSSQRIKINHKICEFLSELAKVNLNQKTKYDDLVNELVLERCFSFMKKYIDNLTNKKTKIFKVLEETKVV